MSEAPKRIRLSRAKGWRLPPNTVNVARPGRLGNPFIVGKDGPRAECVGLFALMMSGKFCLTGTPSLYAQELARFRINEALPEIKGQDVACWCALEGPCHGDVILALANEERRDGMLDRFLHAPLVPIGGGQ